MMEAMITSPATEPNTPSQRVSVVDINMPFGSMVLFMVKWAIAAIPALLILACIGMFVATLLVAINK
jgi:hypothetical protein